MQNMHFYYDFSGQKFDYPLSFSINQFDRQVFLRQSSLEISYVLKGSYEVTTEGMSQIIQMHELVVIAPYDIHMVKPLSEESVILTVHIHLDYLPQYMCGDINHSFQSMICNGQYNNQKLILIKKQLGQMLEVMMQDHHNLYVLNHIVSGLLMIVSHGDGYAIEDLPIASKNHENYMQAILFIDKHYLDDIHLEDIADNLSFSMSYTSRLFKKYAGVSFVKYLARVRVRHSIDALLAGKSSIEEIAYDCGLSSAKAYTQAFKDIYGITPSIYRKQFSHNLKVNHAYEVKPMKLEDEHWGLVEHLLNRLIVYEDEHVVVYDDGRYVLKDITGKEIVVRDNQLVVRLKND